VINCYNDLTYSKLMQRTTLFYLELYGIYVLEKFNGDLRDLF